LDGKLHGKWESFDAEGNTLAIANYDKGEKTGNWFFWDGNTLKEVTYDNSSIAIVKTWNQANKIVVK